MVKFIGIIHKDKESDYGVSFPDFPGCVTAGKTMQEAFDMASESLQAHIDVMHEYGDKLPKAPLDMDMAKQHEFAEDALAFFVLDAQLPVHIKRFNVTLPENLVQEIDKVTSNRSGFLAEAAREKLRHRVVA